MGKIFVGLDTETTGLKVEKNDRIIEIALIGYEINIVDQEEVPKEIFRYVKRLNPGKSIDPKAQLIHGISHADLVGKQTFNEIEPFVTKILSKADVIVAHNAMFDITFIANEYSLINKTMPSDAICVDTMSDGRWATSNGKNPNLSELCYALEVDYDPLAAHGAAYDVDVMMQCFFKGVKLGGFNVRELLSK